MKNYKRTLSAIFAASLALSSLGFASQSASAAPAQKWSWDIGGDCSDYNDQNGEFAVFEEDPTYTCYVYAKVAPVKPGRIFYLQYFDKKWKTESSGRTNSKGGVVLYPSTDCGTNSFVYCDGTFTYRLYSPAITGQKALIGTEFELSFYPIG